MDAQVVWGWEMAQVFYMYTQLYVTPLILMLVLSAMAVFRREMSCNHVYALEDGSDTRQVQDSNQSTSSALIPYMTTLLAPLLWLQFDRGDDIGECDDAPDADCGNKDTLSVPLQWPGVAQQALDGIIARFPQQAFEKLSEASLRIIPRQRKVTMPAPLHPEKFPADVQVNIMSFLQPKDVVTFACTSRSCREIVDGNGQTPTAVWKTLWQRDYGWIMQSWKVGRQALERSNVRDLQPYGREFYFRFGLSYTNYLLAGLNSHDSCFVGLHGNIYDISDFVSRHPGSPETLFVHAGRDATKLFDDMDHSKGARRLAKEFCIAVDMSYDGSCGLRPTLEFDNDRPIPATVDAKPVIGKKERRLRPPECLKKVYDDYSAELHQHQKELNHAMKDNKQVLHWSPYYDPYQRAWKSWYTSRDFETVFQ